MVGLYILFIGLIYAQSCSGFLCGYAIAASVVLPAMLIVSPFALLSRLPGIFSILGLPWLLVGSLMSNMAHGNGASFILLLILNILLLYVTGLCITWVNYWLRKSSRPM